MAKESHSDIVLIPDPEKLCDLAYLEAHAVVDLIPRDKLQALLPALRMVASVRVEYLRENLTATLTTELSVALTVAETASVPRPFSGIPPSC